MTSKKPEPLTAPTSNAGGHQSFCKSGRSAKDSYFRFAKVQKTFIFVIRRGGAFRQSRIGVIQIKPLFSAKPLGIIYKMSTI
jgi:hypothetical protein